MHVRSVVFSALVLSCTPSTVPTTCVVSGETFQANVTNPDPEFGTCQTCKPTSAQTAWTNAPLGTACGQGLVCIAQGRCSRVFRKLSNTGMGSYADVTGSSADEVWAVGPTNVALRSTDRGMNFTQIAVPGAEARYGVFAPAAGRAFVVGASGTVLETQNGGASWQARPSPMRRVLRGIWGSSATDLFVVGADGYIARSTDGAQSWTALRSTADAGVSLTLNAVWGNDQAVYAVGEGGIILRSTDRTTFTRAGITSNAEFKAVFGTASGDVFVVGSAGSVLRTRDGTTWQTLPRPSTDDLADVWGVDTEIYLASASGRLYRSTNSGDRWVEVASAGAQILNGIWGSGLDDIYAVGAPGVVLHLP